MNNINDLFIDVNTFDVDNISYIKPIMFYKVARNMGVYYRKPIITINDKKTKSDIPSPIRSESKKQKIIVKTPKMIVPFGIKEFVNNGKKSYKMSLSFSTLTNLYNEEEIKKFYHFICDIDTNNEETVLEYRSKWGLPKKIKYRKSVQSLSEDFPSYIDVTLPYDEENGFFLNVYDEKAEKSTIDIISKKSIVSVVMELTDLRFTDTSFKSNWTVMQIRKFKTCSPIQDFFMSGCFICDEDDPEDTAYLQIIENYKKKIQTPIMLPNIPQINPASFGYPAPVLNPYYYNNMNFAAQTNHCNQYIATAPAPPMGPGNVPPPPPPPSVPKQKLSEQKPAFVVSLDQLENARNKLKRTVTVVKPRWPSELVEGEVGITETSETKGSKESTTRSKGSIKEPKSKEPTKESKSKESIKEPKSKESIKEPKPKESTRESKPKESTKESKSRESDKESKSKEPIRESKSKESAKESKSKEPAKESKSKEPAKESKSKEPVKESKSKEPVKEIKNKVDKECKSDRESKASVKK